MIISCPECATRFSLSDALIPKDGRLVRCSKCGHKWREQPDSASLEAAEPAPRPEAAKPEELFVPPTSSESAPAPAKEQTGEAETTPPPQPKPELMARRREARPKSTAPEKKRLSPIAIGWVALGLLALIVLGGTLLFRGALVEFWPPMAKLYDTIGFSTETPAPKEANSAPAKAPEPRFQTQGVGTVSETVDGVEYLVVTGEVVNAGEGAGAVPELRVVLRDDAKAVLSESTHAISEEVLSAGGKLSFSVRIPNPPAAARELVVDFLSEGKE